MGKERLGRLLVNGKKCLLERAVIAKKNNQGKYSSGIL